MTTATYKDNLESRVKLLTEAAIQIKKSSPSLHISVEIPENYATPFITFVQSNWTVGDAHWISSICEEFNLTYGITPIEKKLIVRLNVSSS